MLKFWATIITVAVLLFAGSFLLPDSFEISIETPGKVLPNKEWRLVRTGDGALAATLQDNLNGTVDAYAINRFERGDAVQFTLNADIFDDRYISVGDTIGTIYSSEIQLRLTELQGELAAREAALRFFVAGEKPALIEEAQQAVVRAESRAKEHENILARQRKLHEQQVISDEELEAAISLQQVYEADVAIAEAQLKARETGARKEQIDLTNAEVDALRASIVALQERLQYQTISAPLSGYVARSFAADTLVTIRDTTSFLVLMPVNWKDRSRLKEGATVHVEIPEIELTVGGELLDIGDSIHRVNGEQVVPVLAEVKGHYPDILPGILVQTAIQCCEVGLLAYLQHHLE